MANPSDANPHKSNERDDPRPDAARRPATTDGPGDTRKRDENSQHKGGASGTGGVGGTGGSVL